MVSQELSVASIDQSEHRVLFTNHPVKVLPFQYVPFDVFSKV
jgi:hypothetical protein